MQSYYRMTRRYYVHGTTYMVPTTCFTVSLLTSEVSLMTCANICLASYLLQTLYLYGIPMHCVVVVVLLLVF